MRMTHWHGLSGEAREFLMGNAKLVPNQTCPECGHVLNTKHDSRRYSRTYGMFDEELPLLEYTLRDGSKVKEVVQADPWSSGPCIFTCFERENGERIGEWSEEAIGMVVE